MTRDDVCQEFRSCRSWCNKDGKVTCVDLACRGRLPDTEAMADEIVRLRRILAALRGPSEAMVKAVDAALVHAPTRADVFRELIRRAVKAAEQEASNG